MNLLRKPLARIGSLMLVLFLAAPGHTQEETGLYAPSVWDLELGEHAVDLPVDAYRAFACGTNGGPPSLPLADWTGFASCPAEPESGLHEIYFEYDNELELWAKAHQLATQAALYQYTSVYSIPVIASALFDADGFFVGLRLVSDPRVETELRELGITLGGFLLSRFGVDQWVCEDLPQLEGESPFRGFYEKRRCEQHLADEGLQLALETHHYRKPGQRTFDAAGQMLTEGYFRSEVRFQMVLTGEMPNAEERLAEIAARPDTPSEKELRIADALDCAGCDFSGADLKQANLAGANLAGANLAGANLHEANLRDADLSGAILAEANLNGADLRRANLTGADLTDAMLYTATLDGATLNGADLSGVLAGHATMARVTAIGMVAIVGDFIDARLNDSDFTGSDLRGARFVNAHMIRSNFTSVLFTQAYMQFANLREAILVDADVRAVDMLRADLRDTDLTRADFSLAKLNFVPLTGAVIEGAIWENAELPGGFDPG